MMRRNIEILWAPWQECFELGPFQETEEESRITTETVVVSLLTSKVSTVPAKTITEHPDARPVPLEITE